MVIYEEINMNTKSSILQKVDKYLNKQGTFAYRICKLIKDGDFVDVLSSQELVHLLNEGPWKKIKVNNLTSQMKVLQTEDIIKIKILGKGRKKRIFWFPGWVDKNKVEQNLPTQLTGDGILFFTGRDSWTDPNKNFPKVIEMLRGDLCIVDPYYGNGTFYVLEKFGKHRKIRFLSSMLGGEEQKDLTKFNNNLYRFKKEFKNIEMKKYNKFYELHDRYIIGEKSLVIIGHGIKDLANKESFVIFLPENFVKSFLPNLRKIFEERWKKSVSI